MDKHLGGGKGGGRSNHSTIIFTVWPHNVHCVMCIQHFLRLLGTAGAVGCHMEVSPLDCEGYSQ